MILHDFDKLLGDILISEFFSRSDFCFLLCSFNYMLFTWLVSLWQT